jgi:hypothetical protein
MSADNGIYILKTIRNYKKENGGLVRTKPYAVYRVAITNAIDNFDWYEINQPHNLGAYMMDIWGCSPVYENEQEAANYASKLEKQTSTLEYGICRIETDLIFYGDM